MISAVQIGALAACIVILLPMALAGYHLSRNKILFFSASLFISLAIFVHLSPYFPSLTLPLTPSHPSPSSLVVIDDRRSCLSLLNDVKLTHHNGSRSGGSWGWVKSHRNVAHCGFQKLGRVDSSVLLNGSWVLVAGDSQARFFVLSLLDLILFDDEMGSVQGDLFRRHSDYSLVVDRLGLRVDFVWAPYVTNLTELVSGLNRNGSCPDVLVMGSGLWHMLHVTDSIDYYNVLRNLGTRVMSLLVGNHNVGSSLGRLQPHLFWIGLPMLVNSMLNTEQKREKMSRSLEFAYEKGLQSSKILSPSGPFVLLDMRRLSESCGVGCTDDGMHYHGVVYDAAVHIMLNALLIQSQQKL